MSRNGRSSRGYNYDIVTNDGTVAAGATLTLLAADQYCTNYIHSDGSAEKDGSFVLNGGDGADVLTGGAGNDTYYVNNSSDQVIEAANGGDDLVVASVNFYLPSNVERLTLAGTAALSGTGNNLDNVIIGNAGDNILTGYAGNDIIDGGAGNDVAVFNSLPAQTSVSFQGGTVVVTGSEGRDTLTNIEQLQFSGVSYINVARMAPVGALYVAWGGRDANAGELLYWNNRLNAGTVDLAGIKAAILADPLGVNHTNAVVGELYKDLGGRAASDGELQVWRDNVRAGASYADVRTAILDDRLGQTHTASTVNALYQDEFGRAPGSDELSAWQGLIRGGATFDTLLDTLIADHGSDATGTQRLAGTTNADALTASHGHDTVIAGFDAAHDTLTLAKGDVASGNALDPAHAHQLFALDGTPDVLLTLDDHSYVLLQHTSLADLNAANIHLG